MKRKIKIIAMGRVYTQDGREVSNVAEIEIKARIEERGTVLEEKRDNDAKGDD